MQGFAGPSIEAFMIRVSPTGQPSDSCNLSGRTQPFIWTMPLDIRELAVVPTDPRLVAASVSATLGSASEWTFHCTPPPEVFCEGSTGCACGNNSPVGSGDGCVNATGDGAYLTALGSPSVISDTLLLTVTDAAPNQVGIFVQNVSAGVGVPFFDGLLCLLPDRHLVRHYAPPLVPATVTDAAGSGSNAHDLTVGDFSGDTIPGRRIYYQFWFRDNSGPCGAGANISSGLSIIWQL